MKQEDYEEIIEGKKRTIIVLGILLGIFILLTISLLLAFNYEYQKTDYYQEMMTKHCESSQDLMEAIYLYQDIIDDYTDAYDSISFPKLMDCDYWLLDEDK